MNVKGIIKILSEKTIRKISAGEIFYSPSLIIKELLENSIDANSKTIDIFLINSGKTIIKVLDDGIGMNKKDVSICFKRYATSKIERIEDLFKLNTNGFRGEALSFISSISQIEIITKDKESDIGSYIFLDRGIIKKYLPIQTNIGTSIIVKNIFFNIPIRRNFLKSDNVELNNIKNEFNKIALSNFDINFRLLNNNKQIFLFKRSTLKERILDIFSDIQDKYLIPILYRKKYLFINGFITNSSYSRNNKYEQLIFVNNRYISNKNLYKCISFAYEGFLKKNKYPSCFIFLYLKSKYIDVNISPDKTNIFFQDDNFIYNCIKTSIRNIILKDLIKIDNISNIFYSKKIEKNKIIENNYPYLINKIKDNYLFNNKIYELDYNTIFNKKIFDNINIDNKNYLNNNYSIQIYKKYIITNYNSKLIIIDQHRAHQRILYEKFKKNLENNKIYKKKVLSLRINVFNVEIKKLELLNYQLKKIGFTLDIYKYYLIIKSIPYFFNKNTLIKLFDNIFSNINIIKNYQNLILSNIAKIFAIKRGKILNNIEIQYIIKELLLCNPPFMSPFKKNILFSLENDFLDKKFNL